MSTKKPIFMETTEIAAERTAAEVSSCLVQAGATSVSTKWDGGKIVGLAWTMRVGPADLHFALPARVEPVFQLLVKRRSGGGVLSGETKTRLREQAERVAWRQLLRWVQAQLAMIEVGMVKNAEVFMPYIQREDGLTFFEYFENKQLALPAPGEKAN
jgi:hypothetical protein